MVDSNALSISDIQSDIQNGDVFVTGIHGLVFTVTASNSGTWMSIRKGAIVLLLDENIVHERFVNVWVSEFGRGYVLAFMLLATTRRISR